MAAQQKALKRGGRFCVCGSPGGVSCKNTTHTPGIIMHKFPSEKLEWKSEDYGQNL